MHAAIAYYAPQLNNFGDIMTPVFLKHYGLSITPGNHQSDIIGIGSLLHDVHPDYDGMIWSSGLIRDTQLTLRNPKVRVFAVRGQMSLDRINAPAKWFDRDAIVLGDGGLLMKKLFPEHADVPKQFKLGIVPHYVDKDSIDRIIPLVVENNPDNVLVIDICSGLDNVARAINQCECILSSSLHGLVAADSYGIPNRQFTVTTSKYITGNQFKYRDYYSCFGMEQPTPFNILSTSTKEECISQAVSTGPRPHIQERIADLDTATKRMVDATKDVQGKRNKTHVAYSLTTLASRQRRTQELKEQKKKREAAVKLKKEQAAAAAERKKKKRRRRRR